MSDPVPLPPDPPTPASGGERAHPASPLVQLWIGVVAFGWFAAQEVIQNRNPLDIFDGFDLTSLASLPIGMLVLGAILVVGLSFGYWGWWTTKFVIDDHELRIENTGAFTESKRIAYSRIQSVDVAQPFAARLLGLAELRIDVGAGSETKTKISFLRRARATELRDYLMSRAHGRRDAEAGAVPSAGASAWTDLASDDRVLVRLTPADLIVGALLSGELFWMLVAFLVPLGLSIWLQQPAIALGGGLLPLAIAIFGFISKRVIGQFRYTLAETAAGLRITRGLTSLSSQTIPVHRIQSIRLVQPALWRLIGKSRIELVLLGLGEIDGEDASSGDTFLPIGNSAQVRTALEAVWPGLDLDALEWRRPPARVRRLDPFALAWLAHAWDDRVVVTRWGWPTRKQAIVPHARLQSATLDQGPLERRLRIANVQLHSTSIMKTSPLVHLDELDAHAFILAEMDRVRASRPEALLAPEPETDLTAVRPEQ